MDIQKEIKVSEKQPVLFIAGTEFGEFYKAMEQHWKRPGKQGRDPLMASLFYSMGRVHRIREERARRKRK